MSASGPLRLDDPGEHGWRSLHASIARPARTASDADPPRLASLARTWARALELGAPVEGLGSEERLVRGASLVERTEPMELLWSAAPGLVERALSHEALRDFSLLFADRAGLVTRAIGGGGFAEHARALHLIEGATWSEEARGTNAIGTAIAEARPVAVEGYAHFGRRYNGLVCYAAPVHDPSGALLAVIDATSSREVIDARDATIGVRAIEAVAATARAIEEMLRLRAYASAGHAVGRVLTRSLERIGCPVLLVEPPGRIARSNESARVSLAVPGASVSLETTLRLSWDALAREALAPSVGGLLVEDALRRTSWRLKAEPVEAADGTLLAVVAFLERGTAAPRRLETSRASAASRESERAFDAIFARDGAVRSAVELAKKVAASELPVMLLAETGSGKELFAQALHAASARARGPFVALNCGSIAPSLLESELFGHAPGAFTGASPRGRTGLLHAATGGTLFLDEIGEMPLSMQTSLLRVLESGTYLRVGETRESKADVRVVCATCKNLVEMVKAGSFRNDLYFRLKGVILRIPPLRERRDRVALAEHLLVRAGETRPLTPALVRFLETHPWPGNVRELRTVLDVVRVLAGEAPELDAAHLPPDLAPSLPPLDDDPELDIADPLAALEASVVGRALEELGGNVSAAARKLGVARSTVYRMMERYGLKKA
jgi:transcriptional regulator of acetoin/glycerol metabolism